MAAGNFRRRDLQSGSTNIFPTAAITYPTNGQVFNPDVTITITATAGTTNVGGSITNVSSS